MTTTSDAPRQPVVLIILDGFGANPSKMHNAVFEAATPRLDEYFFRYPNTLLNASGRAVGLPDGQMGNSEVGHMTLGSGMLIRQDLVLIDDAIADGSFFSNPAFLAALDKAAARGRPVHLTGLVSDGGVHSHVRHLLALIELCGARGVPPLLHMITDGRDTAPQSALDYLPDVEAALARARGRIATVSGRYYAMDRDYRWERTERAWRAIVLGKGRRFGGAREAIGGAYRKDEHDEFIHPSIIGGYGGMEPEDVVVSFNFRKDRPRQLVAALARSDFAGFDRGGSPLADVTCMMEYDAALELPSAFVPKKPQDTLNRIVSEAGLSQFHCAETEKYAHVTFFFNGGKSGKLPGEEHRLIPSPRVATYDLKPEMSAPQVADAVIEAIGSGSYAFIVVNFANGDMVGHTGIRSAVLQAVETLDHEVGRVLDAAVAADCSVVLTADHGNCDQMVDPYTDEPHTQHTLFPVPFLLVDSESWQLAQNGGLVNVAPTVLQLLGLERPASVRADSLLRGPEQRREHQSIRRLHAA